MSMPQATGHAGRYLCLALSFALLCALAPRHADAQVRRTTLETLTRSATAIVVGTCVEQTSRWNDAGTLILTEVRLRVDERVKGEPPPETVITIPGGRVGNILYEVSDMPSFVEGEQAIVFLTRNAAGATLVAGATQGKLRVVQDATLGRRVIPQAARIFAPEEVRDDGEPIAPQRVLLEDLVERIRQIDRE